MCPADQPPDDHDLDSAARSASAAEEEARAATDRLVRELVLYNGPTLPPLAVMRIHRIGEDAADSLIAVLSDSKLRDPRGPAGGWGPVHAARLLGELCPERAVEPLLDTLATADPLTPLQLTISLALGPLGPPLVAPILARLPTAIGAYRRELFCLLAGSRVRDPRVFAQLLALLAESPEDGAMHLAEYGDPEAIADLSRVLSAYQIGPAEDTRGNHLVFELREAIEELGGTLTPEQEAKYQAAWWGRRVEVSARDQALAAEPPRPDDPCPCRSGRRYKNCCLH